MLIARAFPVMQVYIKISYETYSYKDHCVTLPHNVQSVANVLPRCPEDIPVVVFSVKGEQNQNDITFRVRRLIVLNALIWLKDNNPLYLNVVIDQQRIS